MLQRDDRKWSNVLVKTFQCTLMHAVRWDLRHVVRCNARFAVRWNLRHTVMVK